MKPLMSKRQIRAIERQLLALGGGRINVLEWGSGGSTVYFTEFLERHGIPYKWTSIEYNRPWYERVQERTAMNPHISLELFDVGNKRLHQRHTDMEEYITYPRTTEERYDFILVDGRKRRRCLLEARKLLTARGVVFLHDAHREHYQCALREFPDSFFLTPHLWRGSNAQHPPLRRWRNKLANISMRVTYSTLIAPVFAVRRLLRKIVHQ